MDRWIDIWERQRQQQEALGLGPTEMVPILMEDTSRHLALGLYEEAAELARTVVRFKAHILKQPVVERSAVIGEAADVIKYVLALVQLHGATSEEMYQEILRKTAVVEDRAKGEKLELTHDTKVILVDMDGCVADLSPLDEKLEDAEWIDEEEKIKAEFRATGGFRHLPVIPGAQEGMAELKAMGYKLVIITARPYRRYKRLYADTLEWLKENGIEYDLILFKRDKAEAIAEYIHPAKPICFIEDRAKHALEIVGVGVPVLLFGDYNSGDFRLIESIKRLITVTKDWPSVIRHIKENGNEP